MVMGCITSKDAPILVRVPVPRYFDEFGDSTPGLFTTRNILHAIEILYGGINEHLSKKRKRTETTLQNPSQPASLNETPYAISYNAESPLASSSSKSLTRGSMAPSNGSTDVGNSETEGSPKNQPLAECGYYQVLDAIEELKLVRRRTHNLCKKVNILMQDGENGLETISNKEIGQKLSIRAKAIIVQNEKYLVESSAFRDLWKPAPIQLIQRALRIPVSAKVIAKMSILFKHADKARRGRLTKFDISTGIEAKCSSPEKCLSFHTIEQCQVFPDRKSFNFVEFAMLVYNMCLASDDDIGEMMFEYLSGDNISTAWHFSPEKVVDAKELLDGHSILSNASIPENAVFLRRLRSFLSQRKKTWQINRMETYGHLLRLSDFKNLTKHESVFQAARITRRWLQNATATEPFWRNIRKEVVKVLGRETKLIPSVKAWQKNVLLSRNSFNESSLRHGRNNQSQRSTFIAPAGNFDSIKLEPLSPHGKVPRRSSTCCPKRNRSQSTADDGNQSPGKLCIQTKKYPGDSSGPTAFKSSLSRRLSC